MKITEVDFEVIDFVETEIIGRELTREEKRKLLRVFKKGYLGDVIHFVESMETDLILMRENPQPDDTLAGVVRRWINEKCAELEHNKDEIEAAVQAFINRWKDRPLPAFFQ